MSLLAPWYLLGLAAVSLPVVWHFLRRAPQGRVPFSSLRFLSSSPPTFTRRSRLEHLLLLCLRILALTLIALAFARPFFARGPAHSTANAPGRRVAILLDTSASMRRDGVWDAARRELERVLDEGDAQDVLSFWTFDDQVRTEVGFPDIREPQTGETQRVQIRGRLAALQPSWGATNLGTALLSVAEQLDASHAGLDDPAPLQLVVISDLQAGSRVQALEAAVWPETVQVDFRTVAASRLGNATPHVLLRDQSAEDYVEVRVTNSSSSSGEQFTLHWARDGLPLDDLPSAEIYVPAGQSRIARLELTASNRATEIVLVGDEADFDNRVFLALSAPRPARVLYLGDEPLGDPQGLLYYLDRAAAAAMPEGGIRIERQASLQGQDEFGDEQPQLIVVAGHQLDRLRDPQPYLEAGGRLLIVLTTAETGDLLPRWFGGSAWQLEEAAVKDYAILSSIDFAHPLFAPLGGPRYNDFTKIHFWKYRRVTFPAASGARVIARFDSGDVAVAEQQVGQGSVVLLTSGWTPSDSQFALSSKFVPIVRELVLGGRPRTSRMLNVADALVLDELVAGEPRHVETPGGQVVELDEGAAFVDTNAPGIYWIGSEDRRRPVAVNVATDEGRTDLLDLAALEQLGVRRGVQPTRNQALQQQRERQDIEIEQNQKLWRWLLLAAVGILLMETVVAAFTVRGVPAALSGELA